MKRIILPMFIMVMAFTVGCGGSYSKLIIDTSVNNKLDNIKLLYYDNFSQKMIPVRVNESIKIDETNTIKLYLDLSKTTNQSDIQVISDIKRGAEIQIKIVDAQRWKEIAKSPIPLKSFKGYKQEKKLLTQYDKNGNPVGVKEVAVGEPIPYGQKTYDDQSLIPIEIKLKGTDAAILEDSIIYLSFNYAKYQDSQANVLEGEELAQLVKQLQKAPVVNLRIPTKKNWCIEYKVKFSK